MTFIFGCVTVTVFHKQPRIVYFPLGVDPLSRFVLSYYFMLSLIVWHVLLAGGQGNFSLSMLVQMLFEHGLFPAWTLPTAVQVAGETDTGALWLTNHGLLLGNGHPHWAHVVAENAFAVSGDHSFREGPTRTKADRVHIISSVKLKTPKRKNEI